MPNGGEKEDREALIASILENVERIDSTLNQDDLKKFETQKLKLIEAELRSLQEDASFTTLIEAIEAEKKAEEKQASEIKNVEEKLRAVLGSYQATKNELEKKRAEISKQKSSFEKVQMYQSQLERDIQLFNTKIIELEKQCMLNSNTLNQQTQLTGSPLILENEYNSKINSYLERQENYNKRLSKKLEDFQAIKRKIEALKKEGHINQEIEAFYSRNDFKSTDQILKKLFFYRIDDVKSTAQTLKNLSFKNLMEKKPFPTLKHPSLPEENINFESSMNRPKIVQHRDQQIIIGNQHTISIEPRKSPNIDFSRFIDREKNLPPDFSKPINDLYKKIEILNTLKNTNLQGLTRIENQKEQETALYNEIISLAKNMSKPVDEKSVMELQNKVNTLEKTKEKLSRQTNKLKLKVANLTGKIAAQNRLQEDQNVFKEHVEILNQAEEALESDLKSLNQIWLPGFEKQYETLVQMSERKKTAAISLSKEHETFLSLQNDLEALRSKVKVIEAEIITSELNKIDLEKLRTELRGCKFNLLSFSPISDSNNPQKLIEENNLLLFRIEEVLNLNASQKSDSLEQAAEKNAARDSKNLAEELTQVKETFDSLEAELNAIELNEAELNSVFDSLIQEVQEHINNKNAVIFKKRMERYKQKIQARALSRGKTLGERWVKYANAIQSATTLAQVEKAKANYNNKITDSSVPEEDGSIVMKNMLATIAAAGKKLGIPAPTSKNEMFARMGDIERKKKSKFELKIIMQSQKVSARKRSTVQLEISGGLLDSPPEPIEASKSLEKRKSLDDEKYFNPIGRSKEIYEKREIRTCEGPITTEKFIEVADQLTNHFRKLSSCESIDKTDQTDQAGKLELQRARYKQRVYKDNTTKIATNQFVLKGPPGNRSIVEIQRNEQNNKITINAPSIEKEEDIPKILESMLGFGKTTTMTSCSDPKTLLKMVLHAKTTGFDSVKIEETIYEGFSITSEERSKLKEKVKKINQMNPKDAYEEYDRIVNPSVTNMQHTMLTQMKAKEKATSIKTTQASTSKRKPRKGV